MQDLKSWDSRASQWQEIRNERPIPERNRQRRLVPEVRVAARVVWGRDGEETIDTLALYFAGRDVLIEMVDLRWRLRGVWLRAEDVRRI